MGTPRCLRWSAAIARATSAMRIPSAGSPAAPSARCLGQGVDGGDNVKVWWRRIHSAQLNTYI